MSRCVFVVALALASSAASASDAEECNEVPAPAPPPTPPLPPPPSLTPSQAKEAKQLYNTAYNAFTANKLNEALASFRQYSSVYPAGEYLIYALLMEGVICSTLHRYDDAYDAYVAAEQVEPDAQDVLLNLGLVHYRRNNVREHVRYMGAYIAASPSPDLHHGRGLLQKLLWRGRTPEAEKAFNRLSRTELFAHKYPWPTALQYSLMASQSESA